MNILLTKTFHFSASYSKAGKVFGHNYTLGATIQSADPDSERVLEEKVNAFIIHRVESRDLGLHVDFLKGVPINDQNLLNIFWEIVEREIKPLVLSRLTLARDERSQVAMERIPQAASLLSRQKRSSPEDESVLRRRGKRWPRSR